MNNLSTIQENVGRINEYTLFKLFDNSIDKIQEKRKKIIDNDTRNKLALFALFLGGLLYFLNFPNWFCLIAPLVSVGLFIYFTPESKVNELGEPMNKSIQGFLDKVNYYSDMCPQLFESFIELVNEFNFVLSINKNNEFKNYSFAKNNSDRRYLNVLDTDRKDNVQELKNNYSRLEIIRNEILSTFESFGNSINNKEMLSDHYTLCIELENILNEIMINKLTEIQIELTQRHENTMEEHFTYVNPEEY